MALFKNQSILENCRIMGHEAGDLRLMGQLQIQPGIGFIQAEYHRSIHWSKLFPVAPVEVVYVFRSMNSASIGPFRAILSCLFI
jgi:hypothetical protein